MKPWIVMGILVGAVAAGRLFLWAYPDVIEASAHIGRYFKELTVG
ncbi:hypothetical protein J2T09_000588 [Neorhizobium huautlense]|uniref:Uncharacterized protein n=1 Tax=Neorhizobium huautlense TaxID=67774 RepID=A0ABT9PN08_9HYPH|nr:hypothetical protein [Neorhizobium huautlense]MDP9835846.1 hypothetical protein [Neorhizobium huautlense]